MASLNPAPDGRMLPAFFQVGAAKAGTTSLWAMIEQHPQLGTPVGVKEPQYFLWAEEEHAFDYRGWTRIPRDYQEDFDAYLDLFKVTPETRVLGEASVQYLAHPAAPAKIAARVPDAKILICLREPVARAWSHYTYNLMRTEEKQGDFMKAIEAELASTNPYYASAYVTLGLYAQQVQRWYDTFGRDNVMVVLSEDLRGDLAGKAREVFDFLGLDRDVPLTPPVADNATQGKHPLTDLIYGIRTAKGPVGSVARFLHARLANSPAYRNLQRGIVRSARSLAAKAGAGKPDGIPPEARAFLADYYAADIAELETLINRDLTAWKRAGQPRG
jgi:hypothetical protein